MAQNVTRKSTRKASGRVRKGPAKKATAKKAVDRRGAHMRTAAGKTAIALGRERADAVDRFLLIVDRPPRRIPSEKRITRLRAELPNAVGVKKLNLTQELDEAIAALKESTDGGIEYKEAEEGFIAHAKAYGDSRKVPIKYATWRKFNVPPATLKKAGIVRD